MAVTTIPVIPTWKPMVLIENEKLDTLTPIFIHWNTFIKARNLVLEYVQNL